MRLFSRISTCTSWMIKAALPWFVWERRLTTMEPKNTPYNIISEIIWAAVHWRFQVKAFGSTVRNISRTEKQVSGVSAGSGIGLQARKETKKAVFIIYSSDITLVRDCVG